MASGNFNMEDPAKQEQVRRGHHEYIPTAGKHGAYAPKPYRHQEYPKMMGMWPRPLQAQFKGQPDADAKFADATQDWDRAMASSVVQSKAEEQAWLKENG